MCRVCGGASYVSESARAALNLKAGFVGLGALVVAFAASLPWIAVAGVLAALGYYVAFWHRIPLRAISESEARRNLKSGWFFLALVVFLVLVYAATQYVGHAL